MNKEYTTVGEALDRLSSQLLSQSGNYKRIYYLWFSMNGDMEKKHTTGFYIKPADEHEKYPSLLVYINSTTLLQDFITKRETYKILFALKDIHFKEISFKVSSDVTKPLMYKEENSQNLSDSCKLEDLSESELQEVDLQVKNLPEPLKETVRNTMIFSLRKQKTIKNS